MKGYRPLIQGLERFDNILFIWMYREPVRIPLLQLFKPMWHFQATLAQDKTFGILGLSSERTDPDSCPRLRIDYEQELVDVYANVVRHLIEHSNPATGHNYKLECLLLVRNEDNNSEYQSWISRWDKPGQSWVLGFESFAESFCASKDLPVHIEELKDKNLLGIYGIRVDTITTVNSSMAKPYTSFAEGWFPIRDLWRSM